LRGGLQQRKGGTTMPSSFLRSALTYMHRTSGGMAFTEVGTQ